MKKNALFFCFLFLLAALLQKGNAQSDAKTTEKQRAMQIVSVLGIADPDIQTKATNVLSSHLDSLETVISVRKAKMEEAAQSSVGKELMAARSEAAWNAAAGKLNKLHATFLGRLASFLSEQQIETIKDQLTENGLRAEYNRFLTLLPGLKEQHKRQVMVYLTEARENAMDAETADMRKQWFIKYRGRANNFLAAAGYDLRRATEELELKKQTIKKSN